MRLKLNGVESEAKIIIIGVGGAGGNAVRIAENGAVTEIETAIKKAEESSGYNVFLHISKNRAIERAKKVDFALDIERTLAYIDQLKELDTDSIEPTYQVTGLKNVWRKDVIEKPSPSRDDLLQCAGNNILNSQIKVPKVL